MIEKDDDSNTGRIIDAGSRIIPMSQDVLGKFDSGQSISQTAERTGYRGIRRLRERHLLRRERLHRVLHLVGFLPEYYAAQIDFTERFGKFLKETEPKIAYRNHFRKYCETLLRINRSWLPMAKRFLMTGQFTTCEKKHSLNG